MTSSIPETWQRIAAPVPSEQVEWRIDGKPTPRDGKHVARFVAYISAQFVRERLDSVVPGEWSLTLEALPATDVMGAGGVVNGKEYGFKARLQILGVIREDVGTGDDYKTAASDAFKRAAVRFGVAHDLYAYEQNWVTVDGDGKYAKPTEDPQTAYERRAKRSEKAADIKSSPATREVAAGEQTPGPTPTAKPQPSANPACPKCGGDTWDNRLTKRNTKAPDYKCKNRACDGCIWPQKADDGKELSPRQKAEKEIAAGVIDPSNIKASLNAIGEAELEELPF